MDKPPSGFDGESKLDGELQPTTATHASTVSSAAMNHEAAGGSPLPGNTPNHVSHALSTPSAAGATNAAQKPTKYKPPKHPKTKSRAQAKREREMAYVPTEAPNEQELEAAARVLAYYSQDKDHCDELRQAQSKVARVVRLNAVRYADQLKKFYFDGLSQEEVTEKRKKEFARRMRLTRELRMRELDQMHLNNVLMRATRIERLNELSYRNDDKVLALASGQTDGLLGFDDTHEADVDEDMSSTPLPVSNDTSESDSSTRELGQKSPNHGRDTEPNDSTKRPCIEVSSGVLVEDESEKEPPKMRAGKRQIMESVKASTVSDFIKTVSSATLVGNSERMTEDALGGVYADVRSNLNPTREKSTGQPHIQSETNSESAEVKSESKATLASSGGVHTEEDIFDETDDKDLGPALFAPRACYTCHRAYFRLHKFYADLCPSCARLNWKKRHQVADLKGYTVLLTGSRVKIGFECGLRLLRCGATVIATSRFPHDTARRYAELPDYENWKDRLHVYGLDLRDLKTVVDFCDMLYEKYDSLDCIINNAAQTVRRPVYYYQHILEDELKPIDELPERYRGSVKGDVHSQYHYGRGLHSTEAMSRLETIASSSSFSASTSSHPKDSQASTENHTSSVTVEEVHDDIMTTSTNVASDSTGTSGPMSSPVPTVSEPSIIAPIMSQGVATVPSLRALVEAMEAQARSRVVATTGNAPSAAILSQLLVTREDHDAAMAKFFPSGLHDVTGQQLDLRPKNSWTLKLKDIDPGELVETFAINALAPFIINSRLFRLMNRGDRKPRFVINVSAMEGKFYRNKQSTHPHTNMAKAALNMMTRTSAQDYARYGIYMNSVDTGWINDENPYHLQVKRVENRADFQTPIDEVDAMARILDPLFDGVNSQEPIWGHFLKDYHKTEW